MTDPLDQIMAVMHVAFDPAHGEAWTRAQVGDALGFPNTFYLLAPSPDGTAATAGFALIRYVLDEQELLLLAVRPEWRGRGIGGQLLARWCSAAREIGAARLFLEMRDGNPAEQLYRKFAFEEPR